jgi:uncharacterized protein
MRWLIAWLALLAALVGAPAAAQGYPARPAGPVYDGANILAPVDEGLLDTKLRAYNERTGRALIVATVPSLGDETIETYAETLFNDEWGIGGAGTDQGLLLLVAPNERKVRIETGYGLQEFVTDIFAGRVIRDDITPRFRSGDYAGGINAGIDALVTQLDRTPAEAKAIAEAAEAAQRQRGEDEGFPIGTLIWLAFLFFFFILPMFGRMRGGRRYSGRGSGIAEGVGQVILWNAINSAVNSRDDGGGWGGGGFGGGGGGGFGGFGGGMSGGGGASGGW